MRKIIHVDMDAFYASIEQRDHPEYSGKPLAVGYAGGRGVVAAASYEARKYGIHSAMPSITAMRRCSHLIFTPGRFDVYRKVSGQIMDVFYEYTDIVEPLSLDEAYLDVTENHKNIPSATWIAREIKQKIREKTGLTASAGVSFNKFLAKLASDHNKPDGLFVVVPENAIAFIESLRIEQFHGIGKVTAQKMHRLGIHTGRDLKSFSEAELNRHFGKIGTLYYHYAHAEDDREVKPDRIRKSLGAENTFLEDLTTPGELSTALHDIAETVWQRASRREFYGRTVTLKIKYSDFRLITRSKTLPNRITDPDLLLTTGNELLQLVELSGHKIRLLGLSMSNADDSPLPAVVQMTFDFPDLE